MMQKIFLTVGILCIGLILAAGNVSPAFQRMESGVFYTDHSGGDLTVWIDASYAKRNLSPTASVVTVIPGFFATLYDPDEKVVKDFYWRDEKGELSKKIEYTVKNAEKGVWQLRFSQPGSAPILKWSVSFFPAQELGFMPSRCWIWHKDILALSGRYFLVPPGTSGLLDFFVRNCRAEILDLHGKSIGVLENSGSKKLPLEPGKVYRLMLSAKNPNWCWTGFGGFPFILCKTPELARKLNGGMTPLPDGRFVPLKFQKRVYEWRKSLKKEDLALKAGDLTKYKKEILADWPESTALFFIGGPLSTAKYLIETQNVDPESPEFGRCDVDIGALAYLYTLNKPYNPYYHNKAVMNRVALAFLYELALSKRSMYFPLCGNGTGQEVHSNYAGGDGMMMVSDTVAFMLLANDLDPKLKELWGEGLAFPLRRFYSDRVSCENQSMHWAVKLYAYGVGAGNPLFKELAANFVRDQADEKQNGFIRTGYLQEAYGPDATYQGLCSSMLAYYFHFSGDKDALALWDKIAGLFNHTVAPEPDGRILYGASGFSHRTPGSWVQRQYGAGTALLTDQLENAAVWHRFDEPRSRQSLEDYIGWASGPGAFDYYRKNPRAVWYAFCPFSSFWNLIPPRKVLPNAKLPVEKSTSFDQNFNNEFYFVRRPSYYTGIYAGKTAGKGDGFSKNPPLYPGMWKQDRDILTAKNNKFFSALPGPQLFWTPDYGVLLCSMNWSLYTQWTTRLEGEKTDWIEYGANTTDFKNKNLEMNLKFRAAPLALKRILLFKDGKLEMKLAFDGQAGDSIRIEQLPYVVKKDTKLEYRRNGEWNRDPGTCDAVRWTNEKSAGVMAEFSEPVPVKIGKKLVFRGMEIACLDVTLPGKNFSYTLEGIKDVK